jgi:hypothetical protein
MPTDDVEGMFPEERAEQIGEELAEIFENAQDDAGGWADDIVSDPVGVASDLRAMADRLIGCARAISVELWR